MTKNEHCYLSNNEEREEGGTPPIIETIRLGLIFRLKDTLDHDVVLKREKALVK